MFGIHFIEFVTLAGDENVYKSRTGCQAINFSPLCVFPINERRLLSAFGLILTSWT